MSWEDSKSTKQGLISEAWSVARTDDFQWGIEELKNLQQQWKDAGWAGPDDDADLWEEFSEAKSHFHERRIAARQEREAERRSNADAKERIISEVRSLSSSNDWKNTHERIQRLREDFHEIGSAGRDENQRLRNALNEAAQDFYDNRAEHFARLEQERNDNRQHKERLVSRAESLARSTDWKTTHEALQSLRSEFRQVGSAGKEENQRLNQEFNDACQGFYDARQAYYERTQRERESAAATKERLISRAESLARSTDWKTTHEALQDLRNEFRQAGNAGKDKNQQLQDEFNAACQTFYSRRTEYFSKRDAERKAVVTRKESIINRARSLVNPSNWDLARENMKDLQEEWNRSGRAGKQEEDELWAEFSRIKNNFFEHFKAWKAAQKNNNRFERERRDLERTMRKTLGGEKSQYLQDWEANEEKHNKKLLRSAYMETGRNERGRAVSRNNVGTDGYTHVTNERTKNYGKTTSHATGDIHKHGSHSDSQKGHHLSKGNASPSGKIMSGIINPDKKR